MSSDSSDHDNLFWRWEDKGSQEWGKFWIVEQLPSNFSECSKAEDVFLGAQGSG